MASVRFNKVSKAFHRGPRVLEGVDLDIEDGSFVTLVGPSGCGKSTMLNIVAGFERPSSGFIEIDGQVVNDRSPRDRRVAMVFQSDALYPHMTARRNIAFPLEVARVARAEIDVRVQEMAARLQIEHLLDRRPRELSGGQRQRVALGRALMRRTGLCLFDEPLSSLDAVTRVHLRTEIKKLHEESGSTFVYVTHDHLEAMTMSDRVVVLSAGRIQQAAPPREIYTRPANTFVAAFVGSPPINLLDPSTLRVPTSNHGGRAVIVGLRPEDITMGTGSPPSGAITGRVYVVEPTGADTWVTLEIQGQRVIGRASADFAARSGDPAWARYDVSRALFFDARTEERIG